jgi:anti-anti-sigma factor
MVEQLESKRDEIISATAESLYGRSTSSFHRVGEKLCKSLVEQAVDALRDDLEAGKKSAVRGAVRSVVEALSGEGLNFSDLRFFAHSLRNHTRGALTEGGADDERGPLEPAIEDWFFELVLVATMHFIAQREQSLQERTVKLELEQLESQLAELQNALAEKTRLLEVIRQASTPIAPVVEGILVVPLVGTFDAFRAETLTEKLLQEIARAQARAVILDVSGVPIFDTEAAHLIIRLARTVRMLGTEFFLVGMSAANARTIVELGIDLSHLKTHGTLQDGLAQALILLRLRIAPIRRAGREVADERRPKEPSDPSV